MQAGQFADLPTDRCVAVGDGRALVARVGDAIVAFENRCLHQNSPLAGGRLHEGVLTCPMHFWRYRLPEGRLVGHQRELASFSVEVLDGVVFVDLPEPERETSTRERMLRHAREWSRDGGST